MDGRDEEILLFSLSTYPVLWVYARGFVVYERPSCQQCRTAMIPTIGSAGRLAGLWGRLAPAPVDRLDGHPSTPYFSGGGERDASIAPLHACVRGLWAAGEGGSQDHSRRHDGPPSATALLPPAARSPHGTEKGMEGRVRRASLF